MNLQVYYFKKNFDTQKALRFLKERRLPFQAVDLSKHRLAPREMAVFAPRDLRDLLDTDSPKYKESTLAYTGDPQKLAALIPDHPDLLKTPLIRDGQKGMIGFDEKKLEAWVAAEKARGTAT